MGTPVKRSGMFVVSRRGDRTKITEVGLSLDVQDETLYYFQSSRYLNFKKAIMTVLSAIS